MDPMEQIKTTFFQECDELLASLRTGLLELDSGAGDEETVNTAFRAVHSIKGGAGAFEFEALARFADAFETTLNEMRAGRLTASGPSLQVMLNATDLLTDLVSKAKEGQESDETQINALAEDLASIRTGAAAKTLEAAAADAAGDDDIDGLDFTPVMAPAEAPEPARVWKIEFRPFRQLYAKANDALVLLRELARLGACDVQLDASSLPGVDDLDPEEAYAAWTVIIRTEHSPEELLEVFEFVEGDCDLSITAVDGLESGDGDANDLIQALEADAQPTDLGLPDFVEPEARGAGPLTIGSGSGSDGGSNGPPGAPTTIRVDLDRVDRLIDLVGELVINQAMLAQKVIEAGFSNASNVLVGLEGLEQLTREIQDSVTAIRAQPVKAVFQRIPRLVREIASLTGKQARLVTDGEGTEVDKTVIERLTDPITNMIYNAIDHGIERPEERTAAGKPTEGVVKLSAHHRSGRIVIEVADDGKGINRERVRQIAADKGLIDPSATLADEEVDNLIFLPGFSSDAPRDGAARGVGMDVVKRSIQALGGRISVTSRPGEGSTFTLSLPLTLAVLDGMVVTAEDQTLVAPLTTVIETLQPKPEDVKSLGPQGMVLAVRGAYVPLIDVGMALGFRSKPLDPTVGVALLVEGDVGGRAALMVDAIQGQRQVVIKSLEANYQQVDGVAAATILGDGRVALILDVEAVISSHRRIPPRFEAPPLRAAS